MENNNGRARLRRWRRTAAAARQAASYNNAASAILSALRPGARLRFAPYHDLYTLPRRAAVSSRAAALAAKRMRTTYLLLNVMEQTS